MHPSPRKAPPLDIVIPARAGSRRFPNKPLALLAGRTLIERTWRQAKRCWQGRARVSVATDDDAIAAHVTGLGGRVLRVDDACENGSERVALAIRQLPDAAQVVVNLQGDAPLILPHIVDATVAGLLARPGARVATPAFALEGAQYAAYCARKAGGQSSGTTVVCNQRQQALYFSKGILPQVRTALPDRPPAWQHVGLYAYRRAALAAYLALPATPLEQTEGLEQLRWLEHGLPVEVIPVALGGARLWSIDHPQDLLVAAEILAERGEAS